MPYSRKELVYNPCSTYTSRLKICNITNANTCRLRIKAENSTNVSSVRSSTSSRHIVVYTVSIFLALLLANLRLSTRCHKIWLPPCVTKCMSCRDGFSIDKSNSAMSSGILHGMKSITQLSKCIQIVETKDIQQWQIRDDFSNDLPSLF